MTPSDVEAVLRQHPAVREAVVVYRETKPGERSLVGFIVPEPAYVERVLSGTEEENKRLQKWRKTFDLMQLGKEAAASPVAFNVAGWNSSYTRKPIPAEEMREWVEETVKDILALQPKEILEIGCGTGLLLLRIAPSCTRYVATDIARAVLLRLKEQMACSELSSDAITLFERPADNFEGLRPDSFDTAIINSVVQYFPSATYLTRVMEKLMQVVKPGGKIFIGDVRSLSLVEAYAASVELYQAPSTLSLPELRERVRRRVRQQEELLLSPAFFLALQRRYPKISRVEVRPKRGRFDNELTKFRFNVVLTLGSEAGERIEPEWRDWSARGFTPDAIVKIIERPHCEMLALKNVPNARIESDVAVAREVANSSNSRTIAEVKELVEKTPRLGLHPLALGELAESFGFTFDMSWMSSRTDGSFDLLFRRARPGPGRGQVAISWPQPVPVSEDLAHYSNTPGQTSVAAKLVQGLLEFSKDKFPAEVTPAAFVLVDAIPLKPDGELNTEALTVSDTPRN